MEPELFANNLPGGHSIEKLKLVGVHREAAVRIIESVVRTYKLGKLVIVRQVNATPRSVHQAII